MPDTDVEKWIQDMPERYSTDRDALERDCDMDFFVATGPGGQNRNKVETGVRLRHRPTGLVVEATERRSQRLNREIAFARMAERLEEMQREVKPRTPTRPTANQKEERLREKRHTAELKRQRARVDDE
jgi:protein subunit release factor B